MALQTTVAPDQIVRQILVLRTLLRVGGDTRVTFAIHDRQIEARWGMVSIAGERQILHRLRGVALFPFYFISDVQIFMKRVRIIVTRVL